MNWKDVFILVFLLAFWALLVWLLPISHVKPVVPDFKPPEQRIEVTETPTIAPLAQRQSSSPVKSRSRVRIHVRGTRHPVPTCTIPFIPGYDHDGAVVSIPNPDCP